MQTNKQTDTETDADEISTASLRGGNNLVQGHHCISKWFRTRDLMVERGPVLSTEPNNSQTLCSFCLKVLGKSVGLCKTSKRKDQLYISLLVSVWRIICENFNTNGLILAEI